MVASTKKVIYKAILNLINDKRELSSIRVADIAERANIGKGTVYEYCDSKEQLIMEAVIYSAKKEAKSLSGLIKDQYDFKESYFIIMEKIRESMKLNITLFKYLVLNECSNLLKKTMKMNQNSKFEDIRKSYVKIFREVVEKGLQEGIIGRKPADYEFIIAVNNSLMCLYLYQEKIDELQNLDEQEIIHKSYDFFVKLLN